MPYHFAISELLQVRDGIILLGGGRDGRTVHCPDLCLGVSIGKEPHHNHHHKHTFSSHRCLDHSLEVCSVLVEREIHRAGLFESRIK